MPQCRTFVPRDFKFLCCVSFEPRPGAFHFRGLRIRSEADRARCKRIPPPDPRHRALTQYLHTVPYNLSVSEKSPMTSLGLIIKGRR
jgi:hypothetical protein